MSVKKLTSEQFEIARKEEGLILLDFYADWCGPCRMVAPVVEEVAQLRGDVLVGKINVDDEEALAREFGIVSIPTLIVLKNGKIHKQAVGVRSKEQILELLES
ncbi:MAG: thioredoxin [Ruminococcaceae bacterium]|nr:thioredoxin [Oscillospiraceae bacterium]